MPAVSNAITKGLILSVSSNEDVFARGEKYYRDGKILSLKTQEDTEGATQVKATVEGNYKNYEVTVRLEPDGLLKQYTCSCESHSIWRGACKHVVSVLFSLSEDRTHIAAPELLRQNVRGLTDTLEKLIFEDIDASLAYARPAPADPIRLAPCFHYDVQGETYLTFSVGRSRLYLIKNISAFLTNVRREETVSYGSGLKFNHALHMFDAKSQALLAFALREEALYAEITRRASKQAQYLYNISRANVRAIVLTERNMDEFFDLFSGTEIDADMGGATRVTFTDAMPDIRLHIRHEPTQTTLSAEDFNYRLILGKQWHYLSSAAAVHRLSKNDAQILTHLLRMLAGSTRSDVVFPAGEQGRFLSVILPKLTKLGLICSTQGRPPVREAKSLRVALYFDSVQRDIQCHVQFQYGEILINPLDETGADVLRDAAAEYAVKRRLLVLGFNADATAQRYVLSDNEAIYHFLTGEIETLRDCAEVYVSDSLSMKALKPKMPIMGVRLSGNLLDVKIEDTGYTLHELIDALESYKAKKKFHRLRDGRFLPLEGEAIEQVADLLTALDVSRRDVRANSLTMPAYRALYVDELTSALKIPNGISRNRDFEMLISQFKSQDAPAQYEIPAKLKNVLRAYQKLGYQWLKTLSRYGFGGILADDMGLGKTIQVIAVLLSEKRKGVKSLVVAPTSLLYNWEHEIKRFAPSLHTAVVTGLPTARREILHKTDADVYITTYDTMKRDREAYEGLRFDFLIADEAQNIKNPSTQNARVLKQIDARIRYALTGTPIENALTELWSLFDFIMPGYLHSAHRFSRLYEYPIVHDNDENRAEKLRRQIAPFVLRRIKKNVLTELPDKTETTLLADLLPEQKKIYAAHLMLARGEFETPEGTVGVGERRMRILAQLTRLRQICCHPSLFVEKYEGGSGKLDLVLETIQMAVESGHRLLLFSQFTKMLDMLCQTLDGTPFSYFYLDGATCAQERMDMAARFNAGEREVFLISLKAGGTGLNLTGADVVIHYDPWWNPSVMDQASDRAHRFGQAKAVQVFNMVAKDTIEEKIMELQEKKRNLIDSVITEGGSFVNTLTEEELRALFDV